MDKLPSLSRETLWLRLGGFALIGTRLILFLYFEEALDPRRWIATAKLSDALWPLFQIVVLANVLAIGLILLLAGLRELSLLRNRQARSAALVRLAGANLLFPSFFFVAIYDERVLHGFMDANPVLVVIAFANNLGLVRSGPNLSRAFTFKLEVRGSVGGTEQTDQMSLRLPNQPQRDRMGTAKVRDHPHDQVRQIEAAVEPVGERAKVMVGVLAASERLAGDGEHRLEIAQDGVDPLEFAADPAACVCQRLPRNACSRRQSPPGSMPGRR